MPELPEVETMRRGVLPIVGRRIAGVRRTPCPRIPAARTNSLTVCDGRLIATNESRRVEFIKDVDHATRAEIPFYWRIN